MTLTLVHPQHLSSLPFLPANAHWLYADEDPQCDNQLHCQFGRDRRLIQPLAFQAQAAQLRGNFMAWTDRCLEGCAAEDWIPVSYFKDIFTTPVFLHFVCLVLLNEAFQQGKTVVVITNSAALAEQLAALMRAHGRTLSVLGKVRFRRDAWRIQCLAWRHFLLRPLRLLACAILAHQILGQHQINRLQHVQVLVATFLLAGDLETTGKFRDRFLPGLIDYYQKQSVVAASVACTENLPLLSLRSVYRAMRGSQTLFAPGELFLKFRDIFTGQWRACRAVMRTPAFTSLPFIGVDVSCVAAFWWDIAIRRTVVARIMTALGKRMNALGLSPQLFLGWYENQPLDKAMSISFHLAGSKTQAIAIRQYFPAENLVNFFSSGGEVRHGASPKINWVCGQRMEELFARHDPEGIYLSVPALRYAHLFAQSVTLEPGNSLVVFLTSSLEESLAILDCAFADVDCVLKRFSTIRVKSHQALKADIATLTYNRWPEVCGKAISWEQATSSELLQSAALVLTAGSSVAVEALCCGIPVVLTGRTAGLDVNPLEDIDNADWRIVYFPEEFAALLQNWLPNLPSLETRRVRGREIRDAYFEPSTEDHMRAFLPA